MPELPEVETIVRTVGAELPGRIAARVFCDWPATLRPAVRKAEALLGGRRVTAVGRRGKYVVIRFDDAACAPSRPRHARESITMLVHLRMSGRLLLEPADSPPHRFVHFRLRWKDGSELRFSDARKFGRVIVTHRPEEVLGALGPEPLEAEFSADALGARIRRLRRRLKPCLLDQRVLAGLGNIYVDESLYRAGLHPLRRTDRLSDAEVVRLHAAIRAALQEGIRRNGASIDWVYPEGRMQDYFRVYGRADQPCCRCGAAVRRIVVGQRATYLCPDCQPRP